MNERGLGTGAIVGIVVAIVAVAILVPVSFIFLTGGGALASVPIYPGAQAAENSDAEVRQAITSYGLPSTWSGKAYTTSVSPSTMADWYKSNMTGWTKVSDNVVPITSGEITTTLYLLVYTKGNDAAVVESFDYSGLHILFLLAGPNSSGGTTGATTT